jgi:hypothetical protein
MRKPVIALALFLATSAALAAEEPLAPEPDYSKDRLRQIFAVNIEAPEHEPRLHWNFGYVEFKALGTRWRISYLPIMLPLHGSRPTTTGMGIPSAFELTGIEIPHSPRTWSDSRTLSSERKRIEKFDRERAKVVVNP